MEQEAKFLDLVFSNNPSASTCIILLQRLEQEGDLKRAVQMGTKALGLFPDHVPLLKIMAGIYKKAGFIGLAEQTLNQAALRLDDLAGVYKSLALILVDQNRNEEALKVLRKYLAHFPDDREALKLEEDLKPVEKVEEKKEELLEEITGPVLGGDYIAAPEDLLEKEEGLEIIEEEPVGFQSAEEEPIVEEPATGAELATPTLAEIYFGQGQLQDAIQIYEQYLSSHPEDHNAARRLAELKALIEGESLETGEQFDIIVQRKQRAINILESWLSKIQELNRVQ